jgi:hypothetical protein
MKYSAKNEIQCKKKRNTVQKMKYSAKSENNTKNQTLRVTKFSNKIIYIKMIYFACDLRTRVCDCIIFSCILLISNSTVYRPSYSCNFDRLQKTHSCMFFPNCTRNHTITVRIQIILLFIKIYMGLDQTDSLTSMWHWCDVWQMKPLIISFSNEYRVVVLTRMK